MASEFQWVFFWLPWYRIKNSRSINMQDWPMGVDVVLSLRWRSCLKLDRLVSQSIARDSLARNSISLGLTHRPILPFDTFSFWIRRSCGNKLEEFSSESIWRPSRSSKFFLQCCAFEIVFVFFVGACEYFLLLLRGRETGCAGQIKAMMGIHLHTSRQKVASSDSFQYAPSQTLKWN